MMIAFKGHLDYCFNFFFQASELYCTMFTSHKQEVGNMDTSFEVKGNLMTAQGRSKDQAADVQAEKNTSRIGAGGQLSLVKFYEMWVEPVTKAMCASKKKLKQNIVEVNLSFALL